MIALKLTDGFDRDLELSLIDSFDDENKKIVQMKLVSEDENGDWLETFFYFEKHSELNTAISWLVGMKKQITE